MRVLILGGTTQANQLAQHLAEREDCEPVFSLAGVTKNPVLPGIPPATCRAGSSVAKP